MVEQNVLDKVFSTPPKSKEKKYVYYTDLEEYVAALERASPISEEVPLVAGGAGWASELWAKFKRNPDNTSVLESARQLLEEHRDAEAAANNLIINRGLW